eukprot:9145605-Pyramimonas_sp.AAC.1
MGRDLQGPGIENITASDLWGCGSPRASCHVTAGAAGTIRVGSVVQRARLARGHKPWISAETHLPSTRCHFRGWVGSGFGT